MGTTITPASMTVTITETILLNGYDQWELVLRKVK